MGGEIEVAWLEEIKSQESSLALLEGLFDVDIADIDADQCVPSADLSSVQPTVTRSKPRRRERRRHSDEVHSLRQSALALEHALALLHRRQADRLLAPSNTYEPNERRAVRATWRAVAMRQYGRLQESQQTNHDLRRKLHVQITTLKSLLRQVNRACTELPRQPVHALDGQISGTSLAQKRHELLLTASTMLNSVDTVLSENFNGFFEDFRRVSWTKKILDDGAVKGTSIAGQLVPLPYATIGKGLWRSQPNHHLSVADFNISIQHIEQTENMKLQLFCVSLPTREADSRAIQGVTMHCQFQGVAMTGVLTVSSTLDAEGVGFESKHWLIVQPSLTSIARSGDPMAEMLVKLESKVSGSLPDASIFKANLAQGHTFIHDQLQRRLDDLMLQNSAVQSLG